MITRKIGHNDIISENTLSDALRHPKKLQHFELLVASRADQTLP
jgi:hypothetical protein